MCFLFPVSCSVRYLVNVLCNSSQSQLYVKWWVIHVYACRITYSGKALVTTLPTVGLQKSNELVTRVKHSAQWLLSWELVYQTPLLESEPDLAPSISKSYHLKTTYFTRLLLTHMAWSLGSDPNSIYIILVHVDNSAVCDICKVVITRQQAECKDPFHALTHTGDLK